MAASHIFGKVHTGASLRFILFLALAAALLFFNYSLELGEPLKPVLAYFFYVVEFLLVFGLLARRRLLRPAFFPTFHPPSLRVSLPFAGLTMLLFWLRLSIPDAGLNRIVFSMFGLLALFLALFGFSFARHFSQAFRKELFLAAVFFAAVNFLWQAFYTHWLFLGGFTASIVAWLIGLTFGSPVLDLSNPELPIVGRQPFVAVIYPECSGIQSLILFTAFFVLALAVDYASIDKRKASIAYLLGMAGMFVVTVLRIYLIIAAGVLFSVDFAVQFVHSAISLVLFVFYFALFWKFAFRRIRKGMRVRGRRR